MNFKIKKKRNMPILRIFLKNACWYDSCLKTIKSNILVFILDRSVLKKNPIFWNTAKVLAEEDKVLGEWNSGIMKKRRKIIEKNCKYDA